jgi:CxxC motif-containing protein (DUF1111 family)
MRRNGPSLLLLLSCLAAACEPLVEADPDRVLQGGVLTVYDRTTFAYDQPSAPLADSPALHARWKNGDRLYGLERVADPAIVPGTGGLGPLYVGRACTSCHQHTGRTKPTLFTNGGTGFDFSSHLVFMRSRNGQYFPNYGRVLHDHAVFGVQPEGRLHAEYKEECDTFPTDDHEPYCLAVPRYWITDWYTTPPPAEDLVMSVRTPPRHVGLGLMLAIDRDELRALADQQVPEFGISPRLQWAEERKVRDIGVSGHKAQHFDLAVALGFSSDMGLSSSRYPDNVAEGQPQVQKDPGIEIDDASLADVDLYMHLSGVPARRNVDDPQVRKGEAAFEEAKCHLCHTPTLHTSSQPIELIDGTPLPMLANQTIHPYCDFLLHDMGPRLGDEFSQFEASGWEWRTAPLWGIGLQLVVNGHMHLLHDGRARSVLEAILWHREEEGAVSYEIFRHMDKTKRDALIAFVLSL